MKQLLMKIASPVGILVTKKVLTKHYQGSMPLTSIDKGKKIVVFAPHIDDETIGLGGTMMRLKQSGAAIHIVFVTNGAKSNGQDNQFAIIEQRKSEIESIRDLLGITSIRYLDYEDGEVYKQASPQDFADVIDELTPDLIFTTAFIDAHTDHVHTAHAVADGLKLSEHQPEAVLEYEINCPFPPQEINMLVDISETYKEKVEATKVFKSQVIAFDGFHLLAKLKTNLTKQKTEAVEGFIRSTPTSFIQKSSNLKEANLTRFDHIFKQANRSITLLWAIFQNYKEKENFYLIKNK
ncbi:PIG-L deacetylase family protein [Bacillus timonensis]|uniref:PIG-L deacetylase family protein n=1 Tax=Bacillus timonensis TaxID=1033734 RepID=UPI000288DF39|nr:PIG-L family deacetylase [Bacillus timonensis]